MDQTPVVNYRNLIANIAKLIAQQQGKVLDNESLDDDIKDIVKFEVELDQVSQLFFNNKI